MSAENYLKLITSEHRNKPKFKAMVEARVEFYSHLQEVLSSMVELFDIDYAVGDQLDKIGEWVGISRFIRSPITGIYFEWGNSSVGWSSGVWQGEFSPTSGLTSLPDDIYRTIVKAKIAANRWNGTIPSAYDIWETIFNNSKVVIQDNQNMSIIVAVVGEPMDALLQALLTGGYIPLKPEGVKVAYYAIPVNTSPVFVWGGQEGGEGTGGWSEGSWAKLVEPT